MSRSDVRARSTVNASGVLPFRSRKVCAGPHIVVHIGDGHEAIIVEGAVEIEKPTKEIAARLSDESLAKYPQYGRINPNLYMGGVSVLRPRRVLAWTSFTENATRFRFG